MTLDQTMEHCIEAAAKNKTLTSEIGEQLIGTPFEKYKIECQERAAKYNQFAEWLTELKEAKRLLKAAVEDIKDMLPHTDSCDDCALNKDDAHDCSNSTLNCDVKCKWRYADEAEKLLNKI